MERNTKSSHRFHQEEWTVGILRGGFTTSHELSDLAEVQGRYDRVI
jgi:hypothetical protein